MTDTLGGILPDAARRHGARDALVVGNRRLTFAHLNRLSNQVADALVAGGIAPGECVALFGPNSPEWVICYYGIAKAGAVVIPVNAMLTVDEVGYILEDAGVRTVIAAAEQAAGLQRLHAATPPREIVVWGSPTPEGMTPLEQYWAGTDEDFAAIPRRSGDIAAICYTSGTTGRPKGAVQSHRSVLGSAIGTVLLAARGPQDRIVSALPLPHVYGACVMNGAFAAGSLLIAVPRFEAGAILTAIDEHRATMMDGVPTSYSYLLAHPAFDDYDLSSLTRCWVGGQTMPVATSREFTARTGCPVYEVWGMTELGGVATANPVVGPNKLGTIGITFPGNQMRVVDLADPDRVLAPGERGELQFRGPLTMERYYGNADASHETITADGWLRTGDVATMDGDGYVAIVDRLKDMILTAGYNVYPAEIERVLAMHDDVAVAAVGSVPDPDKGELAKAYVVLVPDATATIEDLITHCRQHLAAYKVPRAVQFVDTLPTTSSGKVMRRALSAQE